MAKSDLGTKRICPTTGKKFYDLNKNPVISPYTGEVVSSQGLSSGGFLGPVVADNALYLLTDDANLSAYR